MVIMGPWTIMLICRVGRIFARVKEGCSIHPTTALKFFIMVYYSNEQVSNMLDEILEKIPTNEHKLLGLRKFIESKKERLNFNI